MKLLFVVNEAGEFVELSRVARKSKEKGHDVAFLFAQPGYVNLRRDRFLCSKYGFNSYFPGKKIKPSAAELEYSKKSEGLSDGYVPYSLKQSSEKETNNFNAKVFLFLMLLASFPLYLYDKLLSQKDKLNSNKKNNQPFFYAKVLYKHLNPDVIVFGQDFPGSVNALLIKLAKKDDVNTVIVPFAVGTTKEMVESLYDKPEYEVGYSSLNKIAASKYPKWINYYKGKALLRLKGKSIIGLEALGLAPQQPWIPNSSAATKIAVESSSMLEYYKSMGFSEEQLELTGAAYDDLLHLKESESKGTEEKLQKILGLKSDKPILLCAWPTDQYGSRNIPLEFKSYEDLCHAWAASLALVRNVTDYQIVIRPHPVTDLDFLKKILKQYKLHKNLTLVDTLEIVSISDVFVACVSSTLRWAIALGIPSINYDCYCYGYTDFNTGKGTSTIESYSEYENALLQLCGNQNTYSESQKEQRMVAKEWAMLDGNSLERITGLLEKLSSER